MIFIVRALYLDCYESNLKANSLPPGIQSFQGFSDP